MNIVTDENIDYKTIMYDYKPNNITKHKKIVDNICINIKNMVPISIFNINKNCFVCTKDNCNNMVLKDGKCYAHYCKCSLIINSVNFLVSIEKKLSFIDRLCIKEYLENITLPSIKDYLKENEIKENELPKYTFKENIRFFYEVDIKIDIYNDKYIKKFTSLIKNRKNYNELYTLREKILVKDNINDYDEIYCFNMLNKNNLIKVKNNFNLLKKIYYYQYEISKLYRIKTNLLLYLYSRNNNTRKKALEFINSYSSFKKRSKYEWYIKNILLKNNISFIEEFILNEDLSITSFKYDFFCIYWNNDNNTFINFMIEYDGIFHIEAPYYIKNKKDRTNYVNNRKIIDKLKNYNCYMYNIPLLRIPHNIITEKEIEDMILLFINKLLNLNMKYITRTNHEIKSIFEDPEQVKLYNQNLIRKNNIFNNIINNTKKDDNDDFSLSEINEDELLEISDSEKRKNEILDILNRRKSLN